MKLLCDEMLRGLARWLRAAGHDTTLADPGVSDVLLIARANQERRVLVSRDRRLVAEAARRTPAMLLVGDDLDGHARQLREALGLDWTHAPLTRCLVDNTPLRSATDAELMRIPDQSQAGPGPFHACPTCGRVFWPGSHVRRITRQLQAWRAPDGG